MIKLQEHYDKIYRYCYFRVRNAELAEDVTQEAFTRFFANRDYVNRGKPLAYLYTVTRNLCADSFRRPADARLTDDVGGHDKNLDASEISFSLKQALEALRHEVREVLLLRYANDLSMSEISNITGLSRFALRRMINGALGELKKTLKKEDFY